MTAVRNRSFRSLAFITAVMTVVALAIPFVGSALANHGDATLDIAEETDSNNTGDTHTLTATITHTTATGTVEVDFEIDCLTDCGDSSYTVISSTGGPVTAAEAGVEGNQNPGTTDDVRTTPELSCSIDVGATDTCMVQYTRNDVGTDEIIGWIDHDKSNSTDESDATEAQNTAGSDTEPDDTDVVTKEWFTGLDTDARLDCDDDGDAADGTPESNPDFENNAPGESHTYTCAVWLDDGAGDGNPNDGIQSGDEAPVAGVRIDAEHEGANDPDNLGFDITTSSTADYDNACTTDATGRCTFTLQPAEGQVGEADVCFWTDEDNDNVFFPDGTQQSDGSLCDSEDFDDPEDDDNRTDVVRKSWATAAATLLDAEPEYDANQQGTQHTVTATVLDQFGNPVAGTPVDFIITGAVSRNDSTPTVDGTGADNVICDNVTTGANGTVSCAYTDVGTDPTTGNPIVANTSEDDIIDVCISGGANGIDCTGTRDTATDDAEFDDGEDQVEKHWFNTVPTAADINVDMEGDDCSTFDETSTNSVLDDHDICVEVVDSLGQGIPGKPVTVTLTGPGEFWTDTNLNGEVDGGELQGQTLNTNADASGQVHATIYSEEEGTTTVTATSDAESDTGTKIWTPLAPRIIDCEPETGTNPLGTNHQITCTVTDRLGNPRSGVQVHAIEDGPGSLTGGSTDNAQRFYGVSRQTQESSTDVNGQVSFTAQNPSGPEGTQTITAALAQDSDDEGNSSVSDVQGAPTDDDHTCDARANEDDDVDGPNTEPGAPAGACNDSVTKTWDETAGPGPIVESGPCSGREQGSRTPITGGTGEIIVGTDGPDALVGTDGDDIICGLAGNDVIDALAGNDQAVGNADDDTIDGGAGRDQLRGGSGNDAVSGRGGNDTVLGGGGDDTLKGNSGRDTLKGGGGNDTIQGGKGVDTAAGGAGRDTLRGWTEDDVLRGNGGNDLLIGNAGNDFLHGGRGRDACRGGKGNDTFRKCESRRG